jgi:hypothetical protein
MRRAIVKAHRTDRHVGPMVLLVCPYCDHRHWLPARRIGYCPRRRNGIPFTIADH